MVEQVRPHTPRVEPVDRTLAAPRRGGRVVPSVVRSLIPVIGVLIGVRSLMELDLTKIGRFGLIEALPKGYYVGFVIVLVSFPLIWSASRMWFEFPIAVISQVVLLHGAPAIAEPLARFPSAWLLSGFSAHIAEHGSVLPLLDARFSWPSMLAGVAILGRAGDLPSMTILLKWWPVFINLACIPPLYVIADTILADRERALLAVWLFPLANWVGQDYYSPQSVAFLLYVTMLVVVLGPFGVRLPWFWRRQPTPEAEGSVTDPTLRRRQVTILLSTMLVLVIALSTGHQLTPVFAVVTVLALSLAGRTSLRVFIVLMGTITLAWICYGAFAYWAGHIDKVFGELGQLTGNIESSASSRVVGSDAHRFVTRARLLYAGVIWGLSGLGFLLGGKLRADRLSAGILFAAPFSILAVQSYGGEGGLRVFLMSLPGAICLMALLLTSFPRRPAGTFHPKIAHAAVVFLMTVALVPIFLVTRWGNELFEQTRPDELAAVQDLYAIAPPGSNIVAMDLHLPWMFQSLDNHDYRAVGFANYEPGDIASVESEFRANPNGYLIITTGQVEYGIETYGLPPHWDEELGKELTRSGRFDLIYENPDAKIYRYTGGQ